jgi:hypothetical protein
MNIHESNLIETLTVIKGVTVVTLKEATSLEGIELSTDRITHVKHNNITWVMNPTDSQRVLEEKPSFGFLDRMFEYNKHHI